MRRPLAPLAGLAVVEHEDVAVGESGGDEVVGRMRGRVAEASGQSMAGE